MTTLQVGDLAPDFTLPATSDEPISLSSYRGKKNVVLAFYPFDWSPVCSLQLPGIQENLPQFKALNAVSPRHQRGQPPQPQSFCRAPGTGIPTAFRL